MNFAFAYPWVLTALLALEIGVLSTGDYISSIVVEATGYLVFLFLFCLVCHGELVRLKPSPSALTSFYLSISAGGALGGVIVATICPYMFSSRMRVCRH